MNKLFSKSLLAVLLILICASAFSAQAKTPKKKAYGEKLITALINSE